MKSNMEKKTVTNFVVNFVKILKKKNFFFINPS